MTTLDTRDNTAADAAAFVERLFGAVLATMDLHAVPRRPPRLLPRPRRGPADLGRAGRSHGHRRALRARVAGAAGRHRVPAVDPRRRRRAAGRWPGGRRRLRPGLVGDRDRAGLPHATVDGYDVDAPSVEAARENARECGVDDPVRFHVADVAALPHIENDFFRFYRLVA